MSHQAALEAELDRSKPSAERVRSLCKQILPGLPSTLRGRAYHVLLRAREHVGDQTYWTCGAMPLPNQKTLHADCLRTRGATDIFSEPDVLAEMEDILTYFCNVKSVRYIQGLNELLAPVMTMNDLDKYGRFGVLYRLIEIYLPTTYTSEFLTLQSSFHLLRLLTLYHDPVVSQTLDQYHVGPELYSTGAFLTLFATKLSMEALLCLWDLCVMHSDPLIFYFFALAFTTHSAHRRSLMDAGQAHLPAVMSSLKLSGVDDVITIFNEALDFEAKTPRTFRSELFRHTHTTSVEASKVGIHTLSMWTCMQVAAEEVLWKLAQENHSQAHDNQRPSVKYLLLDCRSQALFDGGHMPTAAHMDNVELAHPEVLRRRLDDLESLRGCHVCICDTGLDGDTSSTLLALHFLQRGFPYVSTAAGGFAELHHTALEMGVDIMDHDPAVCQICSGFVFLPSGGNESNAGT